MLALIVALASGVVFAAFAGSRRDRSALSRLFAVSRPATVMALPNEPGFDWNAVRTLPYVETVGEFLLSSYVVTGTNSPDATRVGGFLAGDEATYRDVERGVVVAGRRSDPNRADEVMTSPGGAKLGLHVGTHVRLGTWKPSTLARLANSPTAPPPDGPFIDATVVGVLKTPFYIAYGTDDGGVLPTWRFARDYARYTANWFGVPAYNALIRLRGGERDIPALSRDLARIAHKPVEVTDASVITQPARHATSLEANALMGFAVAGALAGLVLLGQAIVRLVAASAIDMAVLQGLGVTRVEQTVALVVAPVVAGIAGVILGVVGAYFASGLFPIGVGRHMEPSPGLRMDALALGGGALVAAALLVAGVGAISAWYVWRGERVRAGRRSVVASAVRNRSAPVPLALGTQLALERAPGRSSVPVVPALVGAVVGVLGVVGAMTFRTGLERAAVDRTLYGQHFDAGLSAENQAQVPSRVIATLTHDPDVTAVNETRVSVYTVQRDRATRAVTVFELRSLKGTTAVVTTSGRAPRAADEIALAPEEARALHTSVGDMVTVGPRRVSMRVVGIAFTPEDSHTSYSEGAWMTLDGLRRVDPKASDAKYFRVLVVLGPHVSKSATIDRLSKATNQEIDPVDLPAPLTYMKNVDKVPLALGAFLALLALAAVGHALASGVRRRRRDLAVLRSLGLTRGQARASVAWQATVLAFVGALFGVPLGLLAGRAIWRDVANTTPVKYVPPVAAVALALALPAAIVAANLLAALPARRAARLRAAEVLRAE